MAQCTINIEKPATRFRQLRPRTLHVPIIVVFSRRSALTRACARGQEAYLKCVILVEDLT
jgi:hypothetical protein